MEGISLKVLQKFVFINNCLDRGWIVSKKGDEYTFKKRIEGRVEIFKEEYLEEFCNEMMREI